MPTLNPNQYGIALHTSSPQLGLSLSNFYDDTRHQTWDLDRDLSNFLHQYLAEFINPLTWQNLAFIAVAKGPGSFTSTRIGVVTARTIAQQLNLPLFGISTLAALAFSKLEHYPSGTIIPVQMKATQEQLYVAIYQKENEQNLKVHLADTVMNPQQWQQVLKELEQSYQLLEAPTYLGTTASSILEIAYRDWKQEKHPHWSEILPFYGF